MNKFFLLPPKSIDNLTSPEFLAQKLQSLIGFHFNLTGKTRTDGSNIRKLVAAKLEEFDLPELAEIGQYEIVPPKGKGVPKIALEFIDTYIVTSGASYNLQVWNRIPNSETLLIMFESGESLKCSDVRFVFVKIDREKNIIASILVLSADYIVKRFGDFGKPTVKQQLLISKKARKFVYEASDRIVLFQDTEKLIPYITHIYNKPTDDVLSPPTKEKLFSIELLHEIVAKELIGVPLIGAATKTRGQALEKLVIKLLGYDNDNEVLHGFFPDIRNQLLEVKIQDSATVDLGRFSPEKEESVIEGTYFTTFDVRYLIALTNPVSEKIEGIILSPGKSLGNMFSYVGSESYKCQRSIPMSFFERYVGQSVFNPE